MLATHGVSALEELLVRLPALADLAPQLLLYPRQRLACHAAELCGLVLYAEQERVLVFDGEPPTRRRTVRRLRGAFF